MSRTVLVRLMGMTISLLRTLFTDRENLVLENLALRQQLAVLKREKPRSNSSRAGRTFWAVLKETWAGWVDSLIIVKPDTVVRWHRERFKNHWRKISRGRPGRPRISVELRKLIRRIASENPSWGVPRLQSELLKLGFVVSVTTVERYRPTRPTDPAKAELWKAFLRNHMPEIAAMDFCTVPTATFKVLYCFFVIHHHRRRILHFNVTEHPTMEWVIQQLRETFSSITCARYVIHDRDSKFGAAVADWLKGAGIKPVRISFRAPWQNGIAERWVRSLRTELLDHVIVLNEAHTRRLIAGYVSYYNEDRCHLTLDGDSPEHRPIQPRPPGDAEVVALPRVGGVHRRYEWRQAA